MRSLCPLPFALALCAAFLVTPRDALAQPADAPLPEDEPVADEPQAPPGGAQPELASDPAPPVISQPMGEPLPEAAQPVEPEPPMSEGRMLVSLYNSGFQWGIAPGVIFSRGKAGFALGVRFGYGFDTGPVIVVPGIRLNGYFMDPNVYLGMPTFKLVLPIDRFAPFVEGGAGVGHVAGADTDPSKTGAALMGGGGFMIHFTRVAFGAEASYQVITGTSFKGFGVGPILALGF